MHIEDTQRLVTEIEMLKLVLHLAGLFFLGSLACTYALNPNNDVTVCLRALLIKY